MLRKRVIPVLLLHRGALVKTRQFRSPTYIGDPCNTALIFNELEADELIILDISPSTHSAGPDLKSLHKIARECFMPLTYGGGISSSKQAEEVLQLGFEKIVLNSFALLNPTLISEISQAVGSQAVIVGVDYRKSRDSSIDIFFNGGRLKASVALLDWCQRVEDLGAGELILTSISAEGTWGGYDIATIKVVSASVGIPVIAHGGAGSLADIEQLFNETEALGAGAGSMFVFQNKGQGVLVNMPPKEAIDALTSFMP